MRYRDTVSGAQAAEIPALDAARKPLPTEVPVTSTKLADHEMIRLNFGADRDQRIFRDADSVTFALRLDLATANCRASALGR